MQTFQAGDEVFIVHDLVDGRGMGTVIAAYPDVDDLVAVRVRGREVACSLRCVRKVEAR